MISFTLILIAAICKAVSDTLADHYGHSIFRGSWWDKSTSWRNKWKNGDPANGEAFPGSSTVLVFTTDAWHLFNMVQYTAFFLAVVLYQPVFSWWVDFLIGRVAFGLVFELFYKWLLVRE